MSAPASAFRSTQNLRLRPLWLDDLDDLADVESDPATNRHRPGGPPSRRDIEGHLRAFVRAWADTGVGYWAVEHQGAFVGVGGLRPLVLAGRDCWNLYYRLRPSVWGRGFAAEAAREAVAFAQEQQLRLPVVARTRPANDAAKRVAEKAGLRRRPELDADGFQVLAIDW